MIFGKNMHRSLHLLGSFTRIQALGDGRGSADALRLEKTAFFCRMHEHLQQREMIRLNLRSDLSGSGFVSTKLPDHPVLKLRQASLTNHPIGHPAAARMSSWVGSGVAESRRSACSRPTSGVREDSSQQQQPERI
jgi:hypothetical protein